MMEPVYASSSNFQGCNVGESSYPDFDNFIQNAGKAFFKIKIDNLNLTNKNDKLSFAFFAIKKTTILNLSDFWRKKHRNL